MDTKGKIEQIKDVAILLRKSRGEEEDLDKHKQELVELCVQNGWRYVIYKELGTSQDIKYRPELQKLLSDIQEDLYDAVVVVDKDRLSREGTGQVTINKILMEHDVLIVTPYKVYDLSNDSDMLMSEVEDLMARFEYRMISKRFKRGKKRGAKMGNWVNGTPPFPYVYVPETKSLAVDPEKKKWYRFMVEQFLEGKPFYEIAWELNKMGVKTQRGNLWHENSIRRLLLSEVHLGKIINQKTEGSGHKNKKTKPLRIRPRSEWIIVENCHEAVKTQEEHDIIIATLAARRKVPKTSKQIKLPLTGLVRCGKCKKTMRVYRRKLVNGYSFKINTCQASDPFGNRCKNSGGDAMAILSTITQEAKTMVDELEQKAKNSKSMDKEIQHYKLKKNSALNEIDKKKESIERAYLAYEEGVISLEKYKQRTATLKKEISKLEEKIKSYDILIEKSSNQDKEEKINRYMEMIELIEKFDNIEDDETNQKLNKILKDNIFDIYWTREGDNVTIEVNFI